MSEQQPPEEKLDTFREEFNEAIESTIFIIVSGQEADPIDVNPLGLGIGEESMSELPPEKQEIIKDTLYRTAGISSETNPAQRYSIDVEETGEHVDVVVFESSEINPETGEEVKYYIHEYHHQNGEVGWQLSKRANPLI